MTDTREETGYTKIEPTKQRVPIRDYGKAAKAEAAKEYVKQFMKSKRVEK